MAVKVIAQEQTKQSPVKPGEKKTPVKPGEKKTPVKPVKPVKEKPVVDEPVVDEPVVDEPVVDELPGQVKVVHKRSEKEFVVGRQHYLDNKGKYILA